MQHENTNTLQCVHIYVYTGVCTADHVHSSCMCHTLYRSALVCVHHSVGKLCSYDCCMCVYINMDALLYCDHVTNVSKNQKRVRTHIYSMVTTYMSTIIRGIAENSRHP